MATKILPDGTMKATLTSGHVVRCKAISLKILERFDIEHQALEIPQREAKVIGGAVELVDDPENEEYKEALAEFNSQSMQDLLNMFVLYGMVVELPEDYDWIDKLALIGVTVDEESESQMEIDYVQLVLMEDLMEDLKVMMSTIFMLSGVEEEVIQSWMTMF